MQKKYMTLFIIKHLENLFQLSITQARFLFAALFVVI